MKMVESSPKGQITLREKEKLLIMSNFSFSHSVFKTILLQTCKNKGLFGKRMLPANSTSATTGVAFDQYSTIKIWAMFTINTSIVHLTRTTFDAPEESDF